MGEVSPREFWFETVGQDLSRSGIKTKEMSSNLKVIQTTGENQPPEASDEDLGDLLLEVLPPDGSTIGNMTRTAANET